ncbi:hypothetical protein HU200_014300 [Digitaria exilis]|uniref:Uncharacterized protein n=1 Tax=Digitaria exilis TaxID=1010633 RepID=A0A835FCE3_9POAL|nr:hypothetical protein HU200_014300 [Digitaria exilis]
MTRTEDTTIVGDVLEAVGATVIGLPQHIKGLVAGEQELVLVEGEDGKIVAGKAKKEKRQPYYVGEEIINADLEIKDIAKQMVAECRGFPSALCTIGRSMSNQSECFRWRVAYEMLMIKRPQPNDIEEMNKDGYPCLQFFEDELGDPFLCTPPCHRV